MSSPIDSYGRAIAAYARAAQAEPGEAGTPAPASGFAQMLQDVVGEAVDAGKTAEKAAVSGVMGGTDLTQVVTAVAEAETTLQTIAAVRDRVIEAYKDIMRMPI